jgi:hypothetical protein
MKVIFCMSVARFEWKIVATLPNVWPFCTIWMTILGKLYEGMIWNFAHRLLVQTYIKWHRSPGKNVSRPFLSKYISWYPLIKLMIVSHMFFTKSHSQKLKDNLFYLIEFSQSWTEQIYRRTKTRARS